MTWQGGRQLASMQKDGTTISFSYNDAGLRTEKTVNGATRRYIWNSAQLMADVGASDAFYFHYSSGGELIGYTYKTAEAETECILVKNQQGDVERVISADGTVLAAYTYDAWGNVLTSEGTLAAANPIRYRGYYFDTETSLYYLQSRYYDPAVGRFINADNAIAGVGGDVHGYNLFSYCKNDPVNMSDHTGHWPQWIKNVASAVVSAVWKAVAIVANTAVSSATNIMKASSNSLPRKGKPGSSQTLPNPDGTPKRKRWYGPDGNPERDRDYNHPGNMPFPHDHEWENGERGKEHLPPDPSYEINWEPVIGMGLVVICTVGIIAVAADNVTGVGFADDFLFGPLGTGVGKGLIMIFG